MDKRVTFNVSGTTFITTVTTLNSFGTETTLGALTLQTITDEPIFIDRDPELFRHILNCMRNKTVLNAEELGVPAKLWDMELAYFGLQKPSLADVVEQIKKKKNQHDIAIMIEEFLFWMITQTKNGEYETEFSSNTIIGNVNSRFIKRHKETIKTIARDNGIAIDIIIDIRSRIGFGLIKIYF